MKMSLEELIGKMVHYSSTVLVAKAKGWVTKFAIGAGTEGLTAKADEYIRSLGLVGGDGMVDVDSLHRMVTAGFKAAGHIDLLGGLLGFDPQDAEDFFTYLAKSAQNAV